MRVLVLIVAAASFVTCGSLESAAPDAAPGTQRPPWPDVNDTFAPLDTTRVICLSEGPDPECLFRTDISVHFHSWVTDAQKTDFLVNYDSQVIGVTGFRGKATRFFVRIPDQGPELKDLLDFLRMLRKHPYVNVASTISSSQPIPHISGKR